MIELFEREATVAMRGRVAGCDRDRPVEVLNRSLQILRLAGENTHGVERIPVIGLCGEISW